MPLWNQFITSFMFSRLNIEFHASASSIYFWLRIIGEFVIFGFNIFCFTFSSKDFWYYQILLLSLENLGWIHDGYWKHGYSFNKTRAPLPIWSRQRGLSNSGELLRSAVKLCQGTDRPSGKDFFFEGWTVT